MKVKQQMRRRLMDGIGERVSTIMKEEENPIPTTLVSARVPTQLIEGVRARLLMGGRYRSMSRLLEACLVAWMEFERKREEIDAKS